MRCCWLHACGHEEWGFKSRDTARSDSVATWLYWPERVPTSSVSVSWLSFLLYGRCWSLEISVERVYNGEQSEYLRTVSHENHYIAR